MGDRSPFKRQTATKFWGFETQVWSICFCICFPTGTEHLSYVAHTVRLPRLGLPWKVSSFHHASQCNTPHFDIEGGRTPSIMCNHPLAGNFVTLCKCFPFPNTAHTHINVLKWIETVNIQTNPVKNQNCEIAQPGLYLRCSTGNRTRISHSTNKNQSFRPLNEAPELQGSHEFTRQTLRH